MPDQQLLIFAIRGALAVIDAVGRGWRWLLCRVRHMR
jgi:hypothetical protein